MDKTIQKLLQENQLTHWKMVSENSNQWWKRSDGLEWTYIHDELSWIECLKSLDKQFPLSIKPKV